MYTLVWKAFWKHLLKRLLKTSFKRFLKSSFKVIAEHLLNILLKTPEVLRKGDESNVRVVLEVSTTSPTGGLDRLILHAVCQFHGLLVTSQKAKGKCVVYVTGNYLGMQHTLSSTVCDSSSFVRRRSDVVMRSGSSIMASSRTSDDDWLLVSSMGSMACRELWRQISCSCELIIYS